MSGSLDTADILVVIDKGDELNVSLQPPDQYAVSITSGDTYIVSLDLPTIITTNQSASFYRVADYAVTASYVSGSINSWDAIVGKPPGLVSSSTQINYVEIENIPTGLVSSSQQINTGSFSGQFIGTSSFADTASVATSITFVPETSSFAVSASWAPIPDGVVSSSTQIDYTQIQNKPTTISTASFAITASYVSGSISSWDSLADKPLGLVSSSEQAVQWTVLSSSFAATASSLTGAIESASYAINANTLDGRDSTVFATTGSNNFSGTQIITGSLFTNADTLIFTGSIFTSGNLIVTGGAISASLVGTASYATTASFIDGGFY